MSSSLASALSFDQRVLSLRADRQSVLAANIANADTPDYKARDFDFATALRQAADTQQPLAMERDSSRQLPGTSQPSGMPGLQYRVPYEPSLDGNTVDMDVARANFADNSVKYEAALHAVHDRMADLTTAMQSSQS